MSVDKDLDALARFFGEPGEPSWQFGDGEPFDAHATLERLGLAMTAVGNLLAVLHGDGGHHIDAVGWVQACEDAEEAWLARGAQVPDGPVSEHLRARVASVCQAAIDGDGGCTGPACIAPHQAGELLDAYDDARAEVVRLARDRDDALRRELLARAGGSEHVAYVLALTEDQAKGAGSFIGTLSSDETDEEFLALATADDGHKCVKRMSVPLSRVCSRGTAGCNADREEPEEFERMRAWGRENIIAPEDHAAREAIEAEETRSTSGDLRFLDAPTDEQRAEAEGLDALILGCEQRIAKHRAGMEREHDERETLRGELQALLLGLRGEP